MEARAAGLGAHHGAELEYIFNNLPDTASDSQKQLAEEMHTRFANFIKNGDPNVGDKTASGVEWEKYDPDSTNMLHFDEKLDMASMPEKEDIEFYNSVLLGDEPYYQ